MKRVLAAVGRKSCLMMCMMVVLVMNGMAATEVKAQGNAGSNVAIREGHEWRYVKGTEALPVNWKNGGFDDSNWSRGPSGFGYGNVTNRTSLNDMQGQYSKVYVRTAFNVRNIYTVTGITLYIACDGPFIAYMNGVEIIRNNSKSFAEELDVSGFIHELMPHDNVLAIECSNDDINSSAFSFLPLFEIHEDQEGAE